jgi:hypothetical protein
VLREEVAKSSQVKVAGELELSDTTISQALSGKYGASTAAIEMAVMGRYRKQMWPCPAMGTDIRADACLRFQRFQMADSNPLKHRFMGACPGCDRYLKRG